MSNRWKRTKEAAEHIGHKEPALVNWRGKGTGPAYHKCDRVVLYDVADLDAWVEAQRVEPSSHKSFEQGLDDNWVQLGTVANKVVADLDRRRRK